jgi:hypothetical protein
MGSQQDLTEYLAKTQNNLVQLIALERTLNEQVMQQSGDSSMSVYIQQISERKEAMYNSLRDIYNLKKNIAAGVAVDYKNVMATSNNIKEELSKTDGYIKQYQDLINGANRMNEIADYEYKKYESYRDILRTFVYFSIVMICLTLLVQQPWFPSLIGKGIIILVLTYGLYLVFGTLYWNFRREDKYWDKFRQDAPKRYDEKTGKISLSKWEHNKRAFQRALDSVGGSKEICNAVANAGSARSDQFFAQLDDEIASGMLATNENMDSDPSQI